MALIVEPRMPGFYRSPYTLPPCRPFIRKVDGAEDILFVHGFTGSPADFREYTKAYAEAGFDVYVPLIPGHGSHVCFLERLSGREMTIPFEPILTRLAARRRRVHLAGLSYGAILAAALSLQKAVASLSLFAPAFFLSRDREKGVRMVKRLGLEQVRGRVAKPGVKTDRGQSNGEELTYNDAPLRPAVDLYDLTAKIRQRLRQTTAPVFAVHGEDDLTAPFAANRDFLLQTLPDCAFVPLAGTGHVLPLEPGHLELAQRHIQWLKGLAHD